MTKHGLFQLICACGFCLLANTIVGLGQERLVTFPLTDATVSADRPLLVFAYDGKIGVNLAADRSRQTVSLFTFSVDDSMVLDHYDLASDFGFLSSTSRRRALLKAHGATGLILVYGTDESGDQKFVAFRSDKRGRLSKLWDVSYPPSDISIGDDVAFSEDGSTLYIIYNRTVAGGDSNHVQELNPALTKQPESTQPAFLTSEAARNSHALDVIIPSRTFASIVMLRADDGETLGVSDLGDGGNFSSIWLDSVRQRLIAVAGSRVYLLGLVTDHLAIEGSVRSPAGFSDAIGISEDGRFLLAYGGNSGTNVLFMSFNLDLETTSTLAITEGFAPYAQNFAFHRASGTLLAPLSLGVANDATKNGSRAVNIVTLKGDGTLLHQPDAVIPKRSDGKLNLIQDNNAANSASGALGFVSADTDRVFAFDTLTGDIVNELRLSPNLQNPQNFIQVLDPPGLVVSSNGNAIVLTPLSVKPEITGMLATKKQTIIHGANFLSGARVSIDGADLGSVQRNPENPGHEIILTIGKSRFSVGQEFSVVVNNRDGLSSLPFTFRR
jgi:hypothetical protein